MFVSFKMKPFDENFPMPRCVFCLSWSGKASLELTNSENALSDLKYCSVFGALLKGFDLNLSFFKVVELFYRPFIHM